MQSSGVDIDLSRADWHKSTFSHGNGGNCVESRMLADDRRVVRHSKDPDGPVLSFTPGEWDAFLRASGPASSTKQP